MIIIYPCMDIWIITNCLKKKLKFYFKQTFFRIKDEEIILIGSEEPHINVIQLKPPIIFIKENAFQLLKALKI